MSKYFGKCFGPSTPAPKSSFWLRCPSFLLSKFASQLKLIQSVVRVGILGICVTSSVLRVLSSGFLVSGSQVFSPRHPVPVSFVSGSHVLGSLVSGSQNPMSWVLGLRVSGSLVWESQSPRFRVSGPDFRLCQKISYERGIKIISPRQAIRWARSPRWDLTWFCRDPT